MVFGLEPSLVGFPTIPFNLPPEPELPMAAAGTNANIDTPSICGQRTLGQIVADSKERLWSAIVPHTWAALQAIRFGARMTC